MGATVDEIAAYQTEQSRENADVLVKALEEGSVDLLTFTSSSTVKNFKPLLPAEKFEGLIKGVSVACIGPITADTARDLGFTVHVEAQEYTIDGLCQAIVQYYAGEHDDDDE